MRDMELILRSASDSGVVGFAAAAEIRADADLKAP
jgi:hypothetical protein